MKKIIVILIVILGLPVFCKTITGEIQKDAKLNTNRIYDSATNIPIEGVLIKVPSKNYYTLSAQDGSFKLNTQINAPTIMSLEKNGYKPFSMTIGSGFHNPFNIGIEKTTPKDIVVETNMVHIGDDSFSQRSANAGDFSLSSTGAFYTKDFNIGRINKDENLFIVIGSIIGIDTPEAQRLGQSGVLTAYSSPPELFFNGNKISDIKINGDNQKIKIPYELVHQNQLNNVTLKTGHNMYKITDVDYDDIEFTNLMFEIK